MLKRMVSPLVLALALAGGTAWAAGDADKSSAASDDQQQAASPSGSKSSTMGGSAASMSGQDLLTSNQLMEMKVVGANGENVGDVEQLVIDRQSGRIQGVVVSVGGFLGIGDKDVALPWNQLQLGQDDQTLTTSATKQQLEQAQAWQDPSEQTAAGGASGTSATGTTDTKSGAEGRSGASGTTTSPPPASTTR